MEPEGQTGQPVPAGANTPALDWGVGSYESVAAQLLPAARAVVETAGLRPGERVLDLGCGTGNAALLAAERSGEVTGVDPASRLLEIARTQAAREGKEVTFRHGEAASLPIGDSSVDVILSVFALIFVPDPGAAAAEMSRVLAPRGRIVLSAWSPAGAMFEMTSTAADAVRRAMGAPPGPAPFAWEQRDALLDLLAPHGFSVQVKHHALAFTASSAQQFLDDQPRTIPWPSPGSASLSDSARRKRCAPASWGSWRTATKTPGSSGSPVATSSPPPAANGEPPDQDPRSQTAHYGKSSITSRDTTAPVRAR